MINRITLIVGKSLPIEVCRLVFGVDTLVNSMHAASVAILDGSDPYLSQLHTFIQEVKNELGEYLEVRVVLRGEKEMTRVSYCLYDDRVKLDGTLSEFVCGFFKTVLAKYKLIVYCKQIKTKQFNRLSHPLNCYQNRQSRNCQSHQNCLNWNQS